MKDYNKWYKIVNNTIVELTGSGREYIKNRGSILIPTGKKYKMGYDCFNSVKVLKI